MAFWIMTLVMFMTIFALHASRYNNLRGELNQLQAELAREQREYERMMDQMAVLETHAYVEQLARERLGLVFPDELVFINLAE